MANESFNAAAERAMADQRRRELVNSEPFLRKYVEDMVKERNTKMQTLMDLAVSGCTDQEFVARARPLAAMCKQLKDSIETLTK